MKKTLTALAFLGALTASEPIKAAHIDNLDLSVVKHSRGYDANVSWDFKRDSLEEQMNLLNYQVTLHSGNKQLEEQDIFLLCLAKDKEDKRYNFDFSNLENKFADLESGQKIYASVRNLQPGNPMFTQFDPAYSHEVELPAHAPEPTTFFPLALGALPVLRRRK